MAKKTSLHRSENNIKAIISLLILTLAFSVLVIFYLYKEVIIETSIFKPFMILSVVFMGLLVGLLYLISNSSSRR